jgi:DNA-binding response OmpR family regulator
MAQIVLIDDDITMQSLLKTLLELEGHTVTTLLKPDPASIMASLEKLTPSIVVLDVFLRQLSGFEILESIRSSPGLVQTKVLMTSGSDIKDRCISAGADGFLMKPYMPDALLNWIKNQSSI